MVEGTEQTSSIQFKQSAAQFVLGWKFEKSLFLLGKMLSYLVFVVTALVFIAHILLSSVSKETPVISLMNGHPVSRLLWLCLLCDLVGAYILGEIKRRKSYTSTDDVFSYLDYNSRSFMAGSLTFAWEKNQQLSANLMLYLLMQSPYMQNMLVRLEVSASSIMESLSNSISLQPIALTQHTPQIEPTMQQYLVDSANRALKRGDGNFGLADIFLTLLEKDAIINQFFEKIDISPERFSVVLGWISTKDHMFREFHELHDRYVHTGTHNKAWTSVPTPTLDHYGQDLSLSAANGVAPLVSVRDQQVEEAARILSRTTKNSLILVGEPGVGKSAIVERIALRILSEEVPELLFDKRIVHIDVAAMHGDPQGFTPTFEGAMSEAERSGNVIIFISNLEDLATESSGGLPVVELLLPILERTRMQIIGATTMKLYHEQIEQNTGITGAFGILEIPEVDEAAAITILEETAVHMEYRHHLEISLKAIEAAVNLSSQYIHDRVLPEKAIDLLDEAAVMVSEAKKPIVLEDDVKTVISQRTNIPITTVSQNEESLLLNLEQNLHGRVIGQEEAVLAVSEALRRARAGLGDSHRPIGTFLFVGPTGVGKTELAKALSDVYFHSEDAMVRLDMSEFQDDMAVERLIGKNNKDGLLTGPVRAHPFTLLLLDEFEKAAGEIRNLFLQVFDDGRITDGEGRVVDFRNSIIIATSNAGSLDIQQAVQAGAKYSQIKDQLVSQILPKTYTPELLNRFDGVIVFKPLVEDDVLQIAKLQIGKVVDQVKRSSGINLEVNEAVVGKLAQLGFDPVYGARPLRRVIQDKLEAPLAKKILSGGLKRGDKLEIDIQDLDLGQPVVGV